jgi:flagellar FliL protein
MADKADKADKNAAAADTGAPRKSPVKMILMIVGALLLIVASAAGGFFANKMLSPPQDEFAGLLHPAAGTEQKEEHSEHDKEAAAEEDCVPVEASAGAEKEGGGGEHGGGGGEHGAKKEEEGGKPPCGPKKKKVEVEAEFATTYYDFPGTFTANLKNSRHFIQVTIALSTQYDDQVITNVKTHEPALKGAVIATLADFTDQEIVGFEAKQIIAERIRDAINNVLVKKTRFGGIEEVVFTSFVTQ